ncbi:hypothetical protein Zmor_022670 [Zophobas morio]|uniref:Tantalus-like domain-containing protein n=1 Tax=Zophobas morio TaxID=2755281 RepID=A0AA38HWZ9_9CUCU|nr:hypothetical protein Zmor_022670 [Zophobas morio]
MELEDTMASLRLNDSLKSPESDKAPPQVEKSDEEPRRSTRFKSRKNYTEKRRVYTKPTKLKDDTVHIKTYYLDKSIKRLSPPLETIYEDNNDEKCLRSFLRTLSNSCKNTKKRKMKEKGVSAQQRKMNKDKLSMAFLLEKLDKIDK